jgi:hypothetical protein
VKKKKETIMSSVFYTCIPLCHAPQQCQKASYETPLSSSSHAFDSKSDLLKVIFSFGNMGKTTRGQTMQYTYVPMLLLAFLTRNYHTKALLC